VTYSLKFSASPDARVTIEGFNPANGRTTWSFDAGRSIGLMTQTLQPPSSGKERVLLRDQAGRYVDLNLRTGAHHVVGATTRAWCRKTITSPQALAYVSAKHKYTTYIGQASLFPCDATGKRLSIPRRIPPVVGDIGARARGIQAWSDAGAIVAVPSD
jgi:hypothetical protein